MASLYKRAGSKYWWIKYRTATGATLRESTKYRRDLPSETRKARAYAAEKTLAELQTARGSERERWERWVPDFISMRYQQSPKSLQRLHIAWRSLNTFLTLRKLAYPSQLAYTDCVSYLKWRTAGDRANGVLAAARNTAIYELKFLHLVMNEAIRRGYAHGNAAARLGMTKDKPREKPAIEDEHIALIREALAVEPDWMRASFEIALYTGCRLRETIIPLNCINLAERTIRFKEPKGGREFTVPIRDELLPLLAALQQAGATNTLEMPRMASKDWWLFFRRVKLTQYSFHCLRVNFISRAARAGVDERQVMRLVNHAGTTIHRVYQRFRVSDLRSPLQAIPLPSMDKTSDEL